MFEPMRTNGSPQVNSAGRTAEGHGRTENPDTTNNQQGKGERIVTRDAGRRRRRGGGMEERKESGRVGGQKDATALTA